MTSSVLFIGILCLICFATPWRVFKPVVFLWAILVTLVWVSIPPVHPVDAGVFDDLARDVLLALLGAVSAVMLGRIVWQAARDNCDFAISNRVDMVVATLGGGTAALVCFVKLAFVLANTGALFAHAVPLIALPLIWRWHPFHATMSASLVILTLYSFCLYPQIVTQAARAAAQGPDYAFQFYHRRIGHNQLNRLTFLTMPKSPHPTLAFSKDGQHHSLRWSYRRHSFEPYWH